MVNEKEEKMYERTTNPSRNKDPKEIYPAAEAPSPQGMGSRGQRHRSGSKAPDPPPNALSLEESPGAGGPGVPEREEASRRSSGSQAGEGEPEAERGVGSSDPGVNAFKKRDELGLANRSKGSSYSAEQRQRIIAEVQSLVQSGISRVQALKNLGICRSTYYGWLRAKKPKAGTASSLQLTPVEKQSVVEKKMLEPQLSHRRISGSLRPEGYWISSSSCYRILKAMGWVSSPNLREAPWKVPRYEPFRPNRIWGEDWTILSIDSTRHYLLTVIDYFSRYIVAWGVVKTVTRVEVQSLLALAYLSEGIRPDDPKPLLRADLGSPNMAHSTRRLIRDLEMVLSPSRSHRPTDNARQERWYRTVKQEEIYCYPTYPTAEIARLSLGRYIHQYNEERPHQALWNYSPGHVHRLGNKSKLLAHYKTMVQVVKEQRLQINRSAAKETFMAVSN
jgi:putative transposase